jgi:hypothetical protein
VEFFFVGLGTHSYTLVHTHACTHACVHTHRCMHILRQATPAMACTFLSTLLTVHVSVLHTCGNWPVRGRGAAAHRARCQKRASAQSPKCTTPCTKGTKSRASANVQDSRCLSLNIATCSLVTCRGHEAREKFAVPTAHPEGTAKKTRTMTTRKKLRTRSRPRGRCTRHQTCACGRFE